MQRSCPDTWVHKEGWEGRAQDPSTTPVMSTHILSGRSSLEGPISPTVSFPLVARQRPYAL